MTEMLRWTFAIALVMATVLNNPYARADDIGEELRTDLKRMTGDPVAATNGIGLERTDEAGIYARCHCSAKALFTSGVIYLGSGIDLASLEGRAVLFHELVHAKQWAQRGAAADCQEWITRENEAVMLERRWRTDHGARLPPPPFYQCKE